MNLPFGLPILKEAAARKKDDSAQAAHVYEHTLAEYRDTLENYKKSILEYSYKLDGYDKRSMDNQLSIVQTALDMTYLKEQGDKTTDQLEELNRQLDNLSHELEDMKAGPVNKVLGSMESLSSAVLDTNYKIDGLDKNVVNRLSELLLELQKQTLYQNKQLQAELLTGIDKLSRSMKKGHSLLWFVFALNIFGLGVLVFLVLYVLEIIPISF